MASTVLTRNDRVTSSRVNRVPPIGALKATAKPAERAARPHRRENASKAELLVTGSLITIDGAQPKAEAMAVTQGRVLAVGTGSDR